jgi:hypothetical protein
VPYDLEAVLLKLNIKLCILLPLLALLEALWESKTPTNARKLGA